MQSCRRNGPIGVCWRTGLRARRAVAARQGRGVGIVVATLCTKRFSFAMLRKFLLSSAAFLGLCTGTAHADTETDPSEQITVSAARRPIRQDEIGTALTLITEEQIKTQQRRSLPDILTRQPGLNVVRSGGMGATTSIFMRGNNANEVKVRLDGMDINDGSAASGAFDAGQFMTDGLGRIEILRGPQSGLYGADAMAGVIDMTTAQGQGRIKPFVRLEGGSYGTFNQVMGARGSQGRFHYNVELSHYRMDGFHSIPRYIEQYYGATRAQHRKTNRNDNRAATIRLGYDVTQNFDLGLTSRLIQSNYHTYSAYDLQSESYGDGNVRQRNTTNLAIVRGTAHLASFGGLLDQVIGLGYMTNRNRWSQTGLSSTGPDYYRSSRLKIDWHGTVNLHEYGTVLVGAEHFHETFDTSHTAATLYDTGYHTKASMDTTAGYGQYEGNWHKILYGAANVRYDSNSRYGNYVTWRVAPAVHIPGTGTVLKASAGSGFHGPSLYQLFASQIGSYYTQTGNPYLRAEKLIGYDAGVEQKLLKDTLSFGATWYDNKVKNLIQSTSSVDVSPSGYQTYNYSYGNVARARMYGVEAFANWKALKTLEFTLNYTWTHARDTTSHTLLQRRPDHKLNFTTTWQPVTDLTLSGNILYTSSWRDVPVIGTSYCSTCGKGHGYFTIDLAATYKINRIISIFARADNLLNRQYEEPIGYLQPGRAGYGGVTLSY
ncbi:MAG: TonB-dependent receptor plug domain-containing protein [Acetobacter sp.]|uniref:TonB-dependent receptor plug domain-containing protein n=1 Tax=Acetobacter sp. TaxID=440 RepID=UPI003F8EBF4C